ncbi:MAG: toxin-antitoxin system HicB family antitoxin [Austwickia sp.]|jgi:predicted HicB family RNase H-like nuclease|nr:MAG: toxin-antitoxin system HicB family antitoxin [Austwickia sp.]
MTDVDIAHYGYRVTWSAEDQEFVGTCLELPSLSWLAGSQEEALAGIRNLVREVINDLSAGGEPTPEPLATRTYSGKFNVRVGEHLHRTLTMRAAEENLSLNQYLVRRLSEAS